MARRSPQAQVALIAATVFLVVGVSLAAVLIIGVIDGVSGTGPLLLAALAVGVFALAARLLTLARRSAGPRATGPTPPRQSPRGASPGPSASAATARPVHPRPHPRPKSMRP